MKSSVTLEDVAKKANVSRATVSRVINTPDQVSDEIREKTIKAIRELNYSPNRHARALTGQQTKTIGLIFFEEINRLFATPFWGQVVNPIYEELSNAGFEVNLIAKGGMNLDNPGPQSIRLYADFLNSRNVDGFILMGQPNMEFEASFAHSHIPMVMFGSPHLPDSEIVHIDSDNEGGAIAAVEYLFQKGRRKIAVINGRMRIAAGPTRFNGYKLGLSKVGLDYDQNLVAYGDFEMASGRDAMAELLKREPKIDAVFVANDEMAQGAIETLREQNISIPQQIAIVSFDNSVTSLQTEPKLTTISHDYDLIGKELVQALIKELNGERPKSKLIPVHLIPRESA